MYDVLYLDHTSRSETLAHGLRRDSAVDIARAEARRRRVGRMFLTGSESPTVGVVVIVASEAQAV